MRYSSVGVDSAVASSFSFLPLVIALTLQVNHLGHPNRYQRRSLDLAFRSYNHFSISFHPFDLWYHLICRNLSLPSLISVGTLHPSLYQPEYFMKYHFESILDILWGESNLIECKLLIHVVFKLIIILFSFLEDIHTSLFVHFFSWAFTLFWFFEELLSLIIEFSDCFW